MPDGAFRLISNADGASLQAWAWAGARPLRGVVVIAHGAAEHALRYERFARKLGIAGFASFALDHRGHGRSPGPQGLGDFGAAGWRGLVADVGQLVDYARAAHPRLPLALFGHSMGSFAAAELAFERSEALDALVLSGSTALEPGTALLLDFNAGFEPARTFLFDEEAPRGVRSDLPVLLVAGDADPLNRKLEGLHLLERRWRAAGVKRIEARYYAGGRHEMLNETNRDEVTRDLIDWLCAALGSEPPGLTPPAEPLA